MAYLRYSWKCPWYIFWHVSDAQTRDQERVAIWHGDHRAKMPNFSYADVRQMLESGGFSRIPGFSQPDSERVSEALLRFVTDVNEKYGERAG